ncbi:hypothetical protein CDO24_05975 [Sinorhizobium meliloti]|nr:hypothetical protein CDO24_05975 [Sinorhizobium meliloti]
MIYTLGIGASVAGTSWIVAKEIMVAPRDTTIATLQLDKASLESEKSVLEETKANLTEQVNKLSAQVEELQIRLGRGGETVLTETGVFEGASVTTTDGGCNVSIEQASYGVNLSVTVDSQDPLQFSNKKPGDRIKVDGDMKTYYIDLYRVRGNIVDLAVYAVPRI